MFRNILVGVDGGVGGGDAIALATQLRHGGAELTLAHICSDHPHTLRGRSAERVGRPERISDLLDSARREANVDAALRWRSSGSVGRGLHELCEEIEADLLVVGSSRRGLLGRVLMDDDVHAALNGAPCAIAVAPAGYAHRPGGISTIGVGYDGSPESQSALAAARTIAAESGANLSATEVVSLPTYALAYMTAATGDLIEELVDDAHRRVSALGGIDAHAVYGLPAEELTRYSSSVDLLIVGSRGYGPIGRLVHGSTSQQLAHTSHSPLLVLPRTAGTSEATDAIERSRDLAVQA